MSYTFLSLEDFINKETDYTEPNDSDNDRIKEIDITLRSLENEKRELIAKNKSS